MCFKSLAFKDERKIGVSKYAYPVFALMLKFSLALRSYWPGQKLTGPTSNMEYQILPKFSRSQLRNYPNKSRVPSKSIHNRQLTKEKSNLRAPKERAKFIQELFRPIQVFIYANISFCWGLRVPPKRYSFSQDGGRMCG